MKNISADPAATNFLALWKLAETQQLLGQTLDKLSLWPWRPANAGTNSFPTNATSGLLRPLLADLVQEETVFHFRGHSSQDFEAAFAVRVGTNRQSIWAANLQAVLASLEGNSTFDRTANGWSKKSAPKLGAVSYAHSGEWAVVGFNREKQELFNDLLLRISRKEFPGTNAPRKFWVDANLDLPAILGIAGFGGPVASEFQWLSFVTGADEHGAVRSQGQFFLAHPASSNLPPWNIPTNMIHDPVVSFTAVRGLDVLRLPASPFFDAPRELFFWAQAGVPFATYCALPVTNSMAAMKTVTNHLLGEIREKVKSRKMGDLQPLTNGNGVGWVDLPIFAPSLEAISTPGFEALFLSLGTEGPKTRPAPAALFRQVAGSTNAVYYDWEITASRIESWIEIGQLFRVVFHRPQLAFTSPGSLWLKNAGPLLGNTVTVINQNPEGDFHFARSGTLGFNSVELHVLIDWLESPNFPRGFHTLKGP
jgi:hypothetical protein